jgi:hypothetical protein
MQTRTFLGLVVGLITVAGSASAQYPYPQPPPPPAPQPGYGYGYPPPAPRYVEHFGGPGTFAVSNDANVSVIGHSVSNNGGSSWALTLAPAADYFVMEGLSVGGQIEYVHSSETTPGSATEANSTSTTTSSNTFGIGPRVGYNIRFNDVVSFWPKLGLVFSDTSIGGQGGAPGSSGNTFDLVIFAPFLFHPAQHFFVGIGPYFQTDLTSSASAGGVSQPNVPKTTSYGLQFTVGGWFVPG